MSKLSITEQSRRILSPLPWIAVAAFVALGMSAGPASAAQLIEICHDGKALRVDVHAVPAHLEHGDLLGSCDGEVCSPPCNFLFDPVTCADGNTYANQCLADCAGAPGPCVRLRVCSNIWDPVLCDGVVYANECVALNAGCTNITRACACPQIYAPVRCSDGTTYINLCVAECRKASGCTEL